MRFATMPCMALLAGLLSAAPAPAGTALVYDGPGICDGCAEAAAEVARRAGLTPRLVGPAGLDARALAAAEVIIVGGGDDLTALHDGIGGRRLEMIADWVAGGGHYMGLCAGAYLAGRTVDDPGDVPGLDLFQGDAFAYSPFAARVETVTWQGQPLRMYTQEAPGFELDDDFAGKIVAHYADGTPAALLVRHGRGQVALSGPHPEATADWLAADSLPPEPLPGPDLAADFLRLAISRR